MIRLLRFLLTGDWHLHEWESIKVQQVEDKYYPFASEYRKVSNYTRYTLRCKRCGRMKIFNAV